MAYITFQPSDYFNTVLYTGNGSTQSITGVGFQPDWVWQKARNQTYDHRLFDAVRGTTKALYSNTSGSEGTESGVTAFDSDGFSLGSAAGSNGNTVTYASWNWKANGQGSSNTDGSINTTYTSANTTAGFSIIKYTGSGSAGTVGHGLGVTPDLTIRKKLNSSDDWYVHTTLIDDSLDFLRLNTTASKSDSSLTGFTSSTIGVDNSSYEEIIYAFATKKGFSKFGSYTGNGSTDGTFIYTGFKPAFIMLKKTSGTGDWFINDVKRNTFNVVNSQLYPNINNVEENTSATQLDILSNGFKLRGTSSNALNSGNDVYLYMAFAEEPLVSSNDIPATAR